MSKQREVIRYRSETLFLGNHGETERLRLILVSMPIEKIDGVDSDVPDGAALYQALRNALIIWVCRPDKAQPPDAEKTMSFNTH
ncbi:hypothetical protein KCP73_22650 [Salmonella enterica subsp. enterica]|nr:hypothetical protein KCP73_22650 [Salmonella enterica subsp. enterica]